MDQKEIMERIDAIKKELAVDQFDIIKERILERKFHHHKSNRKFLLGRFIEGLSPMANGLPCLLLLF